MDIAAIMMMNDGISENIKPLQSGGSPVWSIFASKN